MNERIKEIRKTLNLTMEKFGKRLGVGKTAISKIEKGDNSLTDQMFKSVCREFNVNEEWLRTGTGEMFIPNTSNELEALAKKYNLSQGVYVFIEKLVNAQTETQDALIRFIKEVGAALSVDDTPADTKAFSEKDLNKLSIDEKVELYRRELEYEEKAEEKSKASQEGA